MIVTNALNNEDKLLTITNDNYVLTLRASKLKLELTENEYNDLKRAIIASYEFADSSNHWVQKRIKSILMSHRVSFDFLISEGYLDQDYVITDNSLSKRNKNRLEMIISDFFDRYCRSVRGYPVATRELIDFLNRKSKVCSEISEKDGESQIINWENLDHDFKALTTQEKEARYELSPFRVVNASVFVGFVRPETTVHNILKIKNNSILLEISGDDVFDMYRLFLTAEQLELYLQGIQSWKLSNEIVTANKKFIENLTKVGFDEEWYDFKVDHEIDKKALAKYISDYDNALKSIDSLQSYLTSS